MKMIVDMNKKVLAQVNNGQTKEIELYSKEAFELISSLWTKVGWDQKYVYTFTWMGRPIIQLPEDMIRIQEVIYQVKPDVIVETGVAHGGSLIYYASLCKAMGKGRVIGVDIEIRPHNRKAIETHELSPYITLIEDDSVVPRAIDHIRSLVKQGESVLVILDSCHTKQHVLRELDAYHDLVTPGSYIIATDGAMRDLCDVPRGNPEWVWDNPVSAAKEFASGHPEFVIEQPPWLFNESQLTENITHWPGAYLKRRL